MGRSYHHAAALPRLLKRFNNDTRGATAIEYGLIAAMISVAIIGALLVFGGSIQGLWDYVADEVVASLART